MRSAGNFNPEWGYLAPVPSFMRTARVVVVATAIGATAGAGVVLSLVERPTVDSEKTSAIPAHAIVTNVQAAAALPVTTMPAAAAASVAPSIGAVTRDTAEPPLAAAPGSVIEPAQAEPSQAESSQAESSQAQSSQVTPQLQAATPTAPSGPAVAAPSVAVAPPQSATATVSAAAISPAAISPAAISPAAETSPLPVQRSAPGIAALSEVLPAAEATPADLPETTTIAPVTPPPQKKVKHTAPVGANSKTNELPSLGSVLRRLFTAHAGNSSYPSRGL